MVSRQAVSKWESGKGAPDIENLKNMANLFGVSVDYLLNEESAAPVGEPVLRQPMDVSALEPTGGRFAFQKSRANTAVRAVYPNATIWPLSHSKKETKSQSAVEWLNAIVFDGPFNIFKTADAVSNQNTYYLVEEKQRTLLVQVSPEAVESRELTQDLSAGKFTIGRETFKKYPRPLAT